MDQPSHLFAGRQGRPGHRKLLAKPAPLPTITPTTRDTISFRGVVCALSAIGVVLAGWVAYVEFFA